MPTAPPYVITVRLCEGAWGVEGPSSFLGPYVSQSIAVQVAALHAKAVIKAGRSPSILVRDDRGKLLAWWRHGVPKPSPAPANNMADRDRAPRS